MSKEKNKADRKLFKKVKKGDIKSFEKLFDNYYQALCNFAFIYLNDEGLSEEIVSDVFINIWQKRNEIIILENLKSYLYKSTMNAVISNFRKKKANFTNLNNLESLDSSVDFITPETLLLDEEFKNKIEQLMDGLPYKAGLVFRMKKIDGLKYKEIAEILNISEKTVENHISKAIKKIRSALEGKPELWKYFNN
ncbi:MAG: hypothetical protein B6D61_13405 [Bacteroidetes bacterium 4484_249]|nr:MAG: hypothetical protein B6D61_13405 [Bacteroidetes bacterium 4484_249]